MSDQNRKIGSLDRLYRTIEDMIKEQFPNSLRHVKRREFEQLSEKIYLEICAGYLPEPNIYGSEELISEAFPLGTHVYEPQHQRKGVVIWVDDDPFFKHPHRPPSASGCIQVQWDDDDETSDWIKPEEIRIVEEEDSGYDPSEEE